jgi:hypothetical protein
MAILRRKLQMKVTDSLVVASDACPVDNNGRTSRQQGDGRLIPEKAIMSGLDSTLVCDKLTSTRYKLRARSNASLLKRLYDSREKRRQTVRSLDSAPTNCLIARSSRNFWTMSSHHRSSRRRRRRGCGFASALCVPRRFYFGEFC